MSIFFPTIPLDAGEREIASIGVNVILNRSAGWQVRRLHVTDQRLILSRRRVSHYFALTAPFVCGIAYLIGAGIGLTFALLVYFYLFFWQRPVFDRAIGIGDVVSTGRIASTNFFDKSQVVVIPRDGAEWRLATARRMNSADDVIETLRKAGIAVNAQA